VTRAAVPPPPLKIIGLMSGTSADGVDAALVEVHPGEPPRVRVVAHGTEAYPAGLRERILAAASSGRTEDVCHLNALLGELLAEAALAIAGRAGVPIGEVDLIGSHGQTIQHLPAPRPEGGRAIRSTLQIGEPSVIAERTGVTTIANFRPRDVAAGGEGAPLVPIVHHLLFTHPARSRVLLNIGGIANVTVLPAGAGVAEVSGFDTGPGNVLMDEFVRAAGLSEKGYDEDGRLAAAGRPDAELLVELLAHPFIRRPPPKSTGREAFGPAMAHAVLAHVRRTHRPEADGVATLAAFTVQAVAENLQAFVFPKTAVHELLVMGGGARNPVLMRGLSEALPECSVQAAEAAGMPARSVEAVAFAILAYLTAAGRPGNVPGVTGAAGPRILGCIVPGVRYRGLGSEYSQTGRESSEGHDQ
jgi:anhydro-N-acetylmuramic acid kinase